MIFKSFARTNNQVRQYNDRFIVDGGWLVQPIELVGIKDNKIVAASTPDSRPFVVLMVQVGRGRRLRYVASDGTTYADLHGEIVPGYRTRRRQWCNQKGPWEFATSYHKRLDQDAKRAVQRAVHHFWEKSAATPLPPVRSTDEVEKALSELDHLNGDQKDEIRKAINGRGE